MALSNNFFRAVTMVGIDVDNGASFTSGAVLFVRKGMHSTSGDIVEETKAAGLGVGEQTVYTCVMARRSDDAKRISISADKYTE